MLLMTLAHAALGAEVVWLDAPSDDDREAVTEAAHATGPSLDIADLRAAATRFSPDDEAALRNLDAALEGARAYESQLDGELLILRDLAPSIAAVTVLRDDKDSDRLFAALAYQGFAVNRLWGDDLAAASEAGAYRSTVNGRALERPWLDAIALDPAREITPYDIAEAPQRVAYDDTREQVRAVLPATLTPRGFPKNAILVVDGRQTKPGPAGNIKVTPGRHLAHLLVGGLIAERWDVRLAPGEDASLTPAVPEPVWRAFIDGVAPGAAIPPEVQPLINALDGDVWLARTSDRNVEILRTSGALLEPVDAKRRSRSAPARGAGGRSDDGLAFTLVVGVLGGWLNSDDFYLQEVSNAPRTIKTVNSGALGGFVSGDFDFGLLRVGAGVDTLITPGAFHTARVGDADIRVRPLPHIAIGVPWAQATAGYLFPYHPALGARARVPVGPLELRALGWAGLGTTRSRTDGTEWVGKPVFTAALGVGAAFP